jgi:hypothetical protein
MKPPAFVVHCIGEAHSNPYIDNCSMCMPYWGHVPLCPTHDRKLAESGYCRLCRKYYFIGRLSCQDEQKQ